MSTHELGLALSSRLTPTRGLTAVGIGAAGYLVDILVSDLLGYPLGIPVLVWVLVTLVAAALLRRPHASRRCSTGSPQRRVLIVSASVGAGHDGAARELARQAEANGYAVDLVDFLDLLPLGAGRLLRSAYRWQLRLAPATWGWLLPLLGSRGGQVTARMTSRLVRRNLLAACHPEPCLAMSTYPLASQALSDLRLRGEFWSPVVTFLTDMSVHPLWVAPGVDLHLALHEIPAAAACALSARGVEVVGTAVDPKFGPAWPGEQARARTAYGLPRQGPISLVVAGSWGVGDVEATVADLICDGRTRPVVICGSNGPLRTSLGHLPGVTALGWVSDMPGLMRACDLVVQNAGGLTSLEARQCGLPVITYRSIPGHGMTNSAALDQAGWATWAHDRTELSAALDTALAERPPPAAPGAIAWSRLVLGPMSTPWPVPA